jgi:O-antigen/teichoic acid export membrane protein
MANPGTVLRAGGLGRLIRKYDDGRGVAFSVATSFLVRAASAVTTLIAMPIALHTLGQARFAAFLVLFGFMTWLGLGSLGVNSALGRALAANDDVDDPPALVGAALVFSSVTSVCVSGAIAAFLVYWSQAQTGRLNAPPGELLAAGAIMVVLTTLQVILQVFEGVQMGRLRIYTTNLMRLAGSLFTFLCLLILPQLWKSMAAFVVALNGGLFLSTLLNAVLVLRRLRPTLRGLGANLGRLRRLATSGSAFVVIGVASLMQTHIPVLILSQMRGAEAAVSFGLLIRLLVIAMAFLGMVTGPLWPALTRARAEGDTPWVRRALLRSGAFVIASGVGALLLVGLFGREAVSLWAGRPMRWSMTFQLVFGVYFLQMAWSHYWGVVLIGLGRERLVAVTLLAEGALIVAFTAAGAHLGGATGAVGGMVLAVAAMTAWILPLAALLTLRHEWATARPA